VFTARYALSPYIKQIRFVFKGLVCQSHNAMLKIYKVYKSKLDILMAYTPLYRRLPEDGELSLKHVGRFKFIYNLDVLLCACVGVYMITSTVRGMNRVKFG
jgi:hypothetical protein